MKTTLIISLFLLTCFVSSTVIATTTYYVNGTTGNDDYNGLYPEPGTFPDGQIGEE